MDFDVEVDEGALQRAADGMHLIVDQLIEAVAPQAAVLAMQAIKHDFRRFHESRLKAAAPRKSGQLQRTLKTVRVEVMATDDGAVLKLLIGMRWYGHILDVRGPHAGWTLKGLDGGNDNLSPQLRDKLFTRLAHHIDRLLAKQASGQ